MYIRSFFLKASARLYILPTQDVLVFHLPLLAFIVKSTVQALLQMSIGQLYKASSSVAKDPQQYSLKVCGRDEILES